MKPRLYLVDAHAYLHRAYHALPPLNNSKGEPVGALYGFARALLQIVRREKPEAVAVCFDHPDPTFRHKAFDAYKATRKEIDGDLISQLKRASEMVCAMGLTCVELAGYEADDVMATLARRAVKDGYDAVLVTADKDALQLAGGGIRVLRDVANGVWMDPPQVEAKYGVPPSAIVDYLSIIGDASDNVPGVKGIGPVGAVKLIKQFGGLKKAVAAAKAGDASIPPKTAKALLDAEKDVDLYLSLIRLDDDAPIAVKPSDCGLPKPDEAKLRAVFERLEFGSLLKELLPNARTSSEPISSLSRAASASAGTAAVAERPAVAVAVPAWSEQPFAALQKDLAAAKELIVAAVHGNGTLVDGSRLHLALALPDGRVSILDEAALKSAKAAVSSLLSGKALKSVYGLKDFENAACRAGLPAPSPAFDAMLAAYCLDPARPKAEPFAAEDWKGKLLWRAGRACGQPALRDRMEAQGVLKLYEELERPLVEVLRDMEQVGVAVDAKYLHRLSADFDADINSLKRKLDEMAGAPINVNSPKQLGELLYDKFALPVLHKTAKGGRSTDEECLRSLAALHPMPAKILEYRELTKLKSTYIDGLLDRLDPETGRVHTCFEQTGAETGRLSSINPNLQNIPIRSASGQKIRKAFVAPRGHTLVSADYSQIDLRVLAHVSEDAVLMDSFRAQEDIHTRTASEVFKTPPDAVDVEMRRRAKAVNFGIVYGQTAFGLSAELGIPQRDAAAIIQAYFERYKGVSRWLERNLEAARREGLVRTFMGRVRHLPELSAKNTALRQFGERAARNTPIQGGSADIIKVAMLRVHEALSARKFKSRLLLQIHDELLFETPDAELKTFVPWVRRAMEEAVTLRVPLVVDVKAGPNWNEMSKVRDA